MQLQTSLNYRQPQASTGNVAHIRPSMEGFVEMGLIVWGDTDTLVLHLKDNLVLIAGQI